MALLDLFYDVTANRLVISQTNAGAFTFPPLYQEDTPDLSLMVLKRNAIFATRNNPTYSVVNVGSYGLQVSIGSAGTILAAQDTWANDGTTFTGTLALNTSGINSLADGAATKIEIRLSGPSFYRTQLECKIYKSVALSGAVVPIPGDTPLGVKQAEASFVSYTIPPGKPILWQSKDGTKKTLQYLHDDGEMRFVKLT
jgi:hypothetical protein